MEFRPCIDIHNGKVKQIVGGSLRDAGNFAVENFVSRQDASYFASLYQEKGCKGGHVILLNKEGSEYYGKTKEQAIRAFHTFPMGLQAGGGITPENAKEFLEAGASHVIVTSYVFSNGQIHKDRLEKLERAVGKERLVLDLSCRRKDGEYYIVTDRWQKFTDVTVSLSRLQELSAYCDEFLLHAADVEGKQNGIEIELVKLLGDFWEIPVTYAGGIHSYEDLDKLRELGKGHVNFTVGSALDLFGGKMSFDKIVKMQ